MGALIFWRTDAGDAVLLVERAGEPLKGYWSLPGGLLETGELLADAVRREVLEETGLIVEPVSRFEIFERIMRDPEGRPEYHYVLVDFICRIKGGALAPDSDVSRVAWVRRDQLGQYKITEGTQEVIERAFAHREQNHVDG